MKKKSIVKLLFLSIIYSYSKLAIVKLDVSYYMNKTYSLYVNQTENIYQHNKQFFIPKKHVYFLIYNKLN